MPETPIIRGRTSTQRGGTSSAGALPALRVRYYSRMRPNRVYPVQVSWKGSPRGADDSGPVQVRLIMAGAQIVPAEQSLDPNDSTARATFYVTPLAKGALGACHAEVIQNGRRIGELRTPSKVTTQRFTLMLLVLSFLVPWLLLQYYAHKLTEEVDAPKLTDKESAEYEKLSIKADDKTKKLTPGEEASFKNLKAKQDAPAKKKTLQDGDVVEHRIRKVIPDVLPQVQQYGGDEAAERIVAMPEVIGAYYTIGRSSPYNTYNIPYYSFWALLLLTFLSFVWHREVRTSRTSKPIELPEG